MKTLTILLTSSILLACGSGSGGGGSSPSQDTHPDTQDKSAYSMAIADESALPECTATNLNQLIYIVSLKSFKTCELSGWVDITIEQSNETVQQTETIVQQADPIYLDRHYTCSNTSQLDDAYYFGYTPQRLDVKKLTDGKIELTTFEGLSAEPEAGDFLIDTSSILFSFYPQRDSDDMQSNGSVYEDSSELPTEVYNDWQTALNDSTLTEIYYTVSYYFHWLLEVRASSMTLTVYYVNDLSYNRVIDCDKIYDYSN